MKIFGVQFAAWAACIAMLMITRDHAFTAAAFVIAALSWDEEK